MTVQLTPAAIAVRLRRLWAGDLVASGELAATFGEGWEAITVEMNGPILTVVGPSTHRDATKGPFGDSLARQAKAASRGAITTIRWRNSSRYVDVRREQTSDLDVFGFEDPLLDAYPAILADVQDGIPGEAPAAARAAVGALRLVGASRHRLWFAARTVAERDALGTVPGARATLFEAVQIYQGAKRPLHHVVVDPSYKAKRQLLIS
ncbi:hypothetical protein [Nocardioides ochotonae]|uniref:hypothetical protein n=1 Tax=Nocardioides ochotonae TaxID=2685869 RepID=UPI00140C2DE6|nr:hypothetical protein [Nocardioides ochotonae]